MFDLGNIIFIYICLLLFVGDEELCLQDLTEDIMELDNTIKHQTMQSYVLRSLHYSMLFYVNFFVLFVFFKFELTFFRTYGWRDEICGFVNFVVFFRVFMLLCSC